MFVALAPVVNLENANVKFLRFAKNLKFDSILLWFRHKLNKYELFKKGERIEDKGLCRFLPFCRAAASWLSDIGNPYDDPVVFKTSFGHYPNGASVN